MLEFDKENKITYEQLSTSLQNKLKNLITREEYNKLDSLVTEYEECLNGVRFSFLDNVSDLKSPVNNQEVAVVKYNDSYTLYVYTNNKWVRIPKNDIYYKLTINQSANQTITVKANNKNYTSSVNLLFGTSWTASIKSTNKYYSVGVIYPDISGIMEDNTEIRASSAILIKNYNISATIGKDVSTDTYGIKINLKDKTKEFGAFNNSDMFDGIYIQKKSDGTYTSRICFYGTAKPPTQYYSKITLSVEINSTPYAILYELPLTEFNNSGDLIDYIAFNNATFYNLFKNNKGKKANFYVHFD